MLLNDPTKDLSRYTRHNAEYPALPQKLLGYSTRDSFRANSIHRMFMSCNSSNWGKRSSIHSAIPKLGAR